MIKNLFTLILALSFVANVKAQNYRPIPESEATWLHTWHDWDNTQPDWQQIVYTDGDTIVNSISYVKIAEKTLNQNGIVSSSYVAAFRNDLINQRVMIIPKDSLNEYLLYDFSVNIGDTISNVFCMEYYGGSIEPSPLIDLYVNQVDSFLLGSDYFKVITLDNGVTGSSDLKWFEGYGSNLGPLGNNGYPSVSYSHQWTCATVDTESYLNVEDSVVSANSECPIALDLTSFATEEVRIFPNPVTTKFEISFLNDHKYSISIYNTQGRLVEKINDASGRTEVITTDYESGVYVVSVRSHNGSVHKMKFIKI